MVSTPLTLKQLCETNNQQYSTPRQCSVTTNLKNAKREQQPSSSSNRRFYPSSESFQIFNQDHDSQTAFSTKQQNKEEMTDIDGSCNLESLKAKFDIVDDMDDENEPENFSEESLEIMTIPQLRQVRNLVIQRRQKHQRLLRHLQAQKTILAERKSESERLLNCAEMAYEDRRLRMLQEEQKAVQTINDLKADVDKSFALSNQLTEEKRKSVQILEILKTRLEEIQKDSDNHNWECTAALQLGCQLNAAIQELTEARQRFMIVRGQADVKRRMIHNRVQELRGNLRVFCRMRPLLTQERLHNLDELVYNVEKEATVLSILLDGKHKSLFNSSTTTTTTSPSSIINQSNNNPGVASCEIFTFDKVFDSNSTQDQVFNEVCSLVQSALDGYNVSLFAYGQTGSGKTYTMDGGWDIPHSPSVMMSASTKLQPTAGIIPRAIELIFDSMAGLIHKGWHYHVKLSALEIYNETVRDLLSSVGASGSDDFNNCNINNTGATSQGNIPSRQQSRQPTTCDIKLDPKGNVVVTNLQFLEVRNTMEVFIGLMRAARHRAVASTACNDQSSRSHSVVQLHIVGERSKDKKVMQSTLSLVDLAGSERLDKSMAVGERLKETQFINKSLSCLCDVICAIAAKRTHIPFRNSKLTLLLRDSLGGNAKTLMFVNVSPLKMSRSETINSLRFASKANSCCLQSS